MKMRFFIVVQNCIILKVVSKDKLIYGAQIAGRKRLDMWYLQKCSDWHCLSSFQDVIVCFMRRLIYAFETLFQCCNCWNLTTWLLLFLCGGDIVLRTCFKHCYLLLNSFAIMICVFGAVSLFSNFNFLWSHFIILCDIYCLVNCEL